ncbi:hypothetical protein ACP70R_046607 [Stipagrostis hirtigluma subsp. patula]
MSGSAPSSSAPSMSGSAPSSSTVGSSSAQWASGSDPATPTSVVESALAFWWEEATMEMEKLVAHSSSSPWWTRLASVLHAVPSSTTPAATNLASPTPCGACKTRRCRCKPRCLLSRVFPRGRPKEAAQSAHEIFGLAQLDKRVNAMTPEQQDSYLRSIACEAYAHFIDPTLGITGINHDIKVELQKVEEELERLAAPASRGNKEENKGDTKMELQKVEKELEGLAAPTSHGGKGDTAAELETKGRAPSGSRGGHAFWTCSPTCTPTQTSAATPTHGPTPCVAP